MTALPAAVRVFEQALADWLAAFTSPAELAAEMADACSDGAPWAAAIAGVAARRIGWDDAEAMAWGLCVGGCAGALEAARRSLTEAPAGTLAAVGSVPAAEGPAPAAEGPAPRAAEGPALPLLAADGLIAAAHETLGSLPPGRVQAALEALGGAFGDGGPWRSLSADAPGPAWVALVPCALAPAADAEPEGPWAAWVDAWSVDGGAAAYVTPDDPTLWDHPAADPDTRALLRSAARAAAAART